MKAIPHVVDKLLIQRTVENAARLRVKVWAVEQHTGNPNPAVLVAKVYQAHQALN